MENPPKKGNKFPKKIWTHNKFSQQLSISHMRWIPLALKRSERTLRQVHRGILTLHSRCPHVTPMTGHVCAKEVPNNWLLMQLEGLINSVLLWNLPFDVSVYTMMLKKQSIFLPPNICQISLSDGHLCVPPKREYWRKGTLNYDCLALLQREVRYLISLGLFELL